MYEYSLYGRRVLSTMEFPQLVKSKEGREEDILITDGEMPPEILEEAKKCYYRIGEQVSWFQNDTGIFCIKDARKIHYRLREGANLQYARTYILGYGMSMLLLQDGLVTIHCSAVAGPKGVILIAGKSGAGKSTLTTYCLNKGYRLMADDIVALQITEDGKVIAYPAFPYQKLCRDTIQKDGISKNGLIYIDETKDKFLVSRKGQFEQSPREVRGFIVLEMKEGTEVAVQQSTGLDKLQAVMENMFLERLQGDWRTKPALINTCLSIAGKLSIYRISRPINTDSTDLVKKAFEQVVDQIR